MDIDIKKVASLAKLKLVGNDEITFKQAIEDISLEMEKIPLDIDDVSLLDECNPMTLRKDEAIKTAEREDILKNAAKVSAGCVEVPRTVE